MPRLADLIFTKPFGHLKHLSMPREYYRSNAVGFLSSGCTVIVADATASLLLGKSGKPFDLEKELPCAAPCFDRFWIEYAHPQSPGNYLGASFDAHELGPDDQWPDRKWQIHALTYMYERNLDLVTGPFAGHVIDIDPAGKIFNHFNIHPDELDDDIAIAEHTTAAQRAMAIDTREGRLGATSFGILIGSLLGLCFLNCKNVTAEYVEPKKRDPFLARRFLRATGRSPMKHYILNIDAMKKVLSSEGNIEHNGLAKALHICKGSFATYTSAHPLFGKVVGTFWRPSHVRGKAENGEIRKWYSVGAPK